MDMKEELRFALKDTGGQFVMIHGITEMLKLSVDNLDSQPQVCTWVLLLLSSIPS